MILQKKEGYKLKGNYKRSESDFDWVAKANYNGTLFIKISLKVGIVLLKIPTQICISKR
jgi:hypothetical protein